MKSVLASTMTLFGSAVALIRLESVKDVLGALLTGTMVAVGILQATLLYRKLKAKSDPSEEKKRAHMLKKMRQGPEETTTV